MIGWPVNRFQSSRRDFIVFPKAPGGELRLEEKVKSHFIDLMWGNLRRLPCGASVAAVTLKRGLGPGQQAANDIIP